MAKTETICVRISPEARAFLEGLGEGKVSVGLDVVLAQAMGAPKLPSTAKPSRAPIPARPTVKTVAPIATAPKPVRFIGKR